MGAPRLQHGPSGLAQHRRFGLIFFLALIWRLDETAPTSLPAVLLPVGSARMGQGQAKGSSSSSKKSTLLLSELQRSPVTPRLLREPLLGSKATALQNRVTTELLQLRHEEASSGEPPRSAASMLHAASATFRALPVEVMIVLLIDFLNSYRNFGFRTIQYNYVVNDFGLSDEEAGYWLGVAAWLQVVFGFAGSWIVDIVGVRRTAIAALTVSLIGRSMLTLGRSREMLLTSLIVFTPFGEAVLSTGIYTVALKKLTIGSNRALAFGLQVFSLTRPISPICQSPFFPYLTFKFSTRSSTLRALLRTLWRTCCARTTSWWEAPNGLGYASMSPPHGSQSASPGSSSCSISETQR